MYIIHIVWWFWIANFSAICWKMETHTQTYMDMVWWFSRSSEICHSRHLLGTPEDIEMTWNMCQAMWACNQQKCGKSADHGQRCGSWPTDFWDILGVAVDSWESEVEWNSWKCFVWGCFSKTTIAEDDGKLYWLCHTKSHILHIFLLLFGAFRTCSFTWDRDIDGSRQDARETWKLILGLRMFKHHDSKNINSN